MWSRAGLNVSGNTVGAEARFTVETFSAGRGDLDITVINPDGRQEKVRNCDLPLREPLCLSGGRLDPFQTWLASGLFFHRSSQIISGL